MYVKLVWDYFDIYFRVLYFTDIIKIVLDVVTQINIYNE